MMLDIKCFDHAIKLTKNKKITGFVNCPVSKEFLFNKKQQGITEFLAKKSGRIGNEVMLIYNNKLLSKDGIIILHKDKSNKDLLPKYFKVIDERVYGISKIIFGNF